MGVINMEIRTNKIWVELFSVVDVNDCGVEFYISVDVLNRTIVGAVDSMKIHKIQIDNYGDIKINDKELYENTQ